GLSKQYTNHCVRVTVVTVLANGGMDVAAIKAVTGHKNSESVDRYKRPKTDKKQSEGAAGFAKRFNGGKNEGAKVPTTLRLELEDPLEEIGEGSGTLKSTEINETRDEIALDARAATNYVAQWCELHELAAFGNGKRDSSSATT